VCRTLLRFDKKARTSARASIGLVKTSGWSCGIHSRSLRTSSLQPRREQRRCHRAYVHHPFRGRGHDPCGVEEGPALKGTAPAPPRMCPPPMPWSFPVWRLATSSSLLVSNFLVGCSRVDGLHEDRLAMQLLLS